MSNTFDNLPENWSLATIDDIASIDSNLVDPANFQNYPHVAPNHIESGTGKLLEYQTIAKDAVKSSKHLFFSGHILYSKIRPYLAKAVLVDFEGLCSADMYPMRAYINSNYLHGWLISGEFTHLVSMTQGRTVLPKVNQTDLKKLVVPLPPLNEQRRIVAKIEALTARSRKAREALDAIPPLLDQFRQSVLAAAFRGDLTADWRAANPNVEPAEKLLERIKVERREQWENAELEKMNAVGKIPKDDKWKNKYEEPLVPQTDKIFPVPVSWKWATLDQIMKKIVDGTHHTPTYTDGGIPFLSVKDIRNEKLYFDECKYISKEEHLRLCERCFPEVNDLLITKSGTIGRCAVVKTHQSFSLFVSVALLKPVSDFLPIDFISMFFQAWFQTVNVQNDVTGSAIKNFHLIDFRKLALPIPPIKEQKEIARQIRLLLGRIDFLREKYREIEGELKQLDQSILAKAFRGELVSQDPTDEPASVLLDRIRAEREKAQKPKGKIAKSK